TSMMSFTPIGTPCSGPSVAPGRTAASAARAAARAPASSTWIHAFTVGSTARMRSRQAFTRAAAVTSPARRAVATARTPSSVERIEHLRDHLEASERRHEIRAGMAAPNLGHQRLRHLDAGAQGGLTGVAQPRAGGVGHRDARHLVVQELGVAER